MQRLYAKALFDNVAESADELDFKRGDLIIVLEQETGGLDGWWLCSLRGKQGIAPGNRLKLVPGDMVNHLRSSSGNTSMDLSPGPQTGSSDWNRRSWDGSTSNKVVVPSRQGDMFTYSSPGANQPDYDVPRSAHPTMNGMPGGNHSNHSSREDLLNASGASYDQSFYETPPTSRSFKSADLSLYDTPPSVIGSDNGDRSSVRTSLLSKYSDETMSMSSGMSYNKSNPPSMCDSARSSMDISPMDLYDVPPSQRERETREAKALLYPIRSSKDSGLDMYDSPPKLKSPPSMLEDYDVPKQAAINSEREKHFKNIQIPRSEPSSPGDTLEDYDVPKSRSPFAQTGSGHSPQNSSIGKPDLNDLDDYDVPKSSQPVVGKPPIGVKSKRQKSNSVGSILDDYDTPSTRFPVEGVSKDDLFAKSKSGKVYNRETSDDENNYDEPDPVKSEALEEDELDGPRPKLEHQEHAVDDLYDTPKNNAPVKNMTKEFSSLSVAQRREPRGVYDIPPQVTRDSVISQKSDSSNENDSGSNSSNRQSLCSTDSRDTDFMIYDELPIDLDAANDLVIRLQQDVQKAVNRFSQLAHSSLKKRDTLVQKMFEFKEATCALEQALGEFVEFGQGTLANSAKLSDRKMINKLSKYLIPLQQALQQMRVCINHLDNAKWQVTKSTNESPKKDDLGIIANITKDLHGDVKKLASFIQGNSSLLFKRAKDFGRSSRASSVEHSTPQSAGKPPAGRKPAIPVKTTPVQARPLPAPPPMERPLPPTPTDKQGQSFSFSGPDVKRLSGDFTNKRNSGEYKHQMGDIQVKRLSVEKNNSFNVKDLQQEYDYVELEEEEKGKQRQENLEESRSNEKVGETPTEKSYDAGNDRYSKEMEETLDDIEGVNIYSDDSGGTLKRGMDLPDMSTDGDNDTGTLKRRPDPSEIVESKEYDSDTLKSTKYDSDTLKREHSPVVDSGDSEKTPTQKEQERVEIPVHDSDPGTVLPIDFEDRQVLAFYSEQLDTHTTLLSNSIDAFYQCIESKQGPKVFISNSKFVIVSAHKLVYIGDSLHKSVKHEQVRQHISDRANYLCECLKHTVTSTKTAALQYPSVPAVQDMVDRVALVSRAAHDLKILVTQASK